MCLAVLGECEPQRFFGAGLADRAGHADHLGFCARTRRSGESAQGGQHIGHDQKRRVHRHGGAAIGGDDGEPRFGRERRGDEFMPVAAIGNGEKRLAATDGAAVNRDSRHGLRQRAVALGAHHRRHILDGPQREGAHAASSLSAAATAS